MASEKKTWYFIRECPLKEQCSSAAWKRAKVYSDTMDGAIEKCARHLKVSSSHVISEDDAFNMATLALVESYTAAADEEEEEQQVAKRQRRSEQPRQVQALGHRDQQLVERAVEAAIDRVAASASSGSGMGGHLVVARTLSMDMRGKKVQLRVTELQAAIDCASRALRAVKEAHRITLAASRSFATEAEALGEAVANLEAVLQTAMGE